MGLVFYQFLRRYAAPWPDKQERRVAQEVRGRYLDDFDSVNFANLPVNEHFLRHVASLDEGIVLLQKL